MKLPSVSMLKKELSSLAPADMLEVCMRLVKYKKENKELLTYLLFSRGDEEEYIREIKSEMDIHFSEINLTHLYFTKKSLRKILRNINKYSRYSDKKETEVELLIYFCLKIKSLNIRINQNVSLSNMYTNQLRKIRIAVDLLHEDLQHDYLQEIDALKI
jgi:hypothetical protein